MIKIHPYVFVGLETNTKARLKSSKKVYVDIESILKIISEEQSVSVEDILSKTRHREVVNGRQLFCYIMRERFGFPYAKIGRLIKRNHATILHSNRVHMNNYQFDKDYKSMCDRVIRRVGEM
jgi:chromosomal replication initiation ATPase DnaA